MNTKTATVRLIFNEDGTATSDVNTNGIPWTMIIENMKNLTQGMSEQLVKDAAMDGIAEKDVADYLQGMINLDREKLKAMFQ